MNSMDTQKKKPGRPRVTGRKPSEGRPILGARVETEVFEAANALAASQGITLSQWVRQCLLAHIHGGMGGGSTGCNSFSVRKLSDKESAALGWIIPSR